MLDLHAVADDLSHASDWRVGITRVRSWSVRDVATGVRLAGVGAGRDELFRLEPDVGEVR